MNKDSDKKYIGFTEDQLLDIIGVLERVIVMIPRTYEDSNYDRRMLEKLSERLDSFLDE